MELLQFKKEKIQEDIQREKNREINDKRISREKILLPVNDKEEPDYEYLMYKKINQYLNYLEKNNS